MILPKLKFKIQPPKFTSTFFPHFFRNIPALAFWSIILAVSLLNLFHSRIFGFTKISQLRYYLLEYPENILLHAHLANYYLTQNQYHNAQNEYQLIQELSPDKSGNITKNVLGISSPPDVFALSQKNKREADIKYWQQINSKFPDYYYASLKLAADFIEMGNFVDAKKYLDEILSKDPKNEKALKLQLLLHP